MALGLELFCTALDRLGINVNAIDASIALPLAPGFDADLHEYQTAGVKFLARQGMSCILADEMGLGKTVQAIRAAAGTGMKRILVIVPAIARWVWDSESRRWQSENTNIYHVEDTANG